MIFSGGIPVAERHQSRRRVVTKRAYGILAGVIGLGAWWYSRRRRPVLNNGSAERGTVIYRNTPSPSSISSENLV
jgi:hypothetical protein